MMEKFSEAAILIKSQLCNFPGVAQLDPFHEGYPPKKGNKYLKKVGKEIFDLINS